MNKTVLLAILLTASAISYGQDGQVTASGSKSYSNKYRTSNGTTTQQIEYDGKIVFNDTDTDVVSISRGGFIKITKKTFGTQRTALLEGKSNGMIERTFKVSGREIAWDPEGREWLADNLIDVIRSTGIGVETRVLRFYKKGGLSAVFNEIDKIDSDFIKGKYFSATAEIDGLSANQLAEVIIEASEEIGSDFETSRFLIGNSEIFGANNLTIDAVIEMNAEISSDFEQSRVLLHYLDNEEFTDTQKRLLVQSSTSISSDFEKSRVLIAYLQQNKLSDSQMEDLTNNLESLGSDFEFARVLSAAIETQDLTGKKIGYIIEASNQISSDFEQSRVLTKLGDQNLSNDNLRLIADATKNISSDFEKSRVLKSIIEDLEKSGDIGFIIDASDNISSDFEQSRILQMVATNSLSNENFKKVMEASENISSNFEKKRVLEILIKTNELNVTKALLVLDSIKEISSNFEKSNLMIAISSKLPDDNEVKERFREVARTITSDFEYGKVMRSVDF